jgi:hypothetical protein
MAKKRQDKNPSSSPNTNMANTSSMQTRSFQKGMIKDIDESLMDEGTYLNARNAVNNSRSGDMGIIGNEPSTEFCTSAPYTVIGAIHLYADRWAVFSTDNTESEVGIFDESDCSYITVVNDQCLGFDKDYLVIGEAKENFDCTWQVYWADGLNPDRTLNLDNPPWIQDCDFTTNENGEKTDCIECTDTDELDCEKLRLARLTKMPCVRLEQSASGGELPNGTYQAVIAYTENEQRVSDYSIPSNTVSMFAHDTLNGSLEVIIEDIDQTYDEFELVIIGVAAANTVAVKIGVYDTRVNRIFLDNIAQNLEPVPLRLIPLDIPAYERSEGIYRNGEYLIRTSLYTRFSFNYQPLANQIQTEWVGVKYPKSYYRDRKGDNVGYMRDEVYSFFIRWIYNTNDKSDSYHIPGRAPGVWNHPFGGGTLDELGSSAISLTDIYGIEQNFETYNTSSVTAINIGTPLADGVGFLYSRGRMGYWESSETYPDDNPEVWDNLCGEHIRHHKMPDNRNLPIYDPADDTIIVLGVQFSGIQYPVDNNGDPIPGIVGYEILRGSREGNKSVVAKGLINNMGRYQTFNPNNPGVPVETYWYPNYPYNDTRPDPFLANSVVTGDSAANDSFEDFAGDMLTFHSPDTQFKNPYLTQKELKIYNSVYGQVKGTFEFPYEHPKFKIIADFSFILSALIGFGIAILSMVGERKRLKGPITNYPNGMFSNLNLLTGPQGVTVPNVGVFPVAGGSGNGGNITLTGIPNPTAELGAASIAAAGTNATYLGLITADDEVNFSNIWAIISGQANDQQTDAQLLNGSLITAMTRLGQDATLIDEYYPQGVTGIPAWLQAGQSIPIFFTRWMEATDATLELIYSFTKARQYALQNQSHCLYDQSISDNPFNLARFTIAKTAYLGDKIEQFDDRLINNIYRSKSVAIKTQLNPAAPFGGGLVQTPGDIDSNIEDTSRLTFSQAFGTFSNDKDVGTEYDEYNNGDPCRASSHYVGLKQRIRNQYGQIDGILQVPTSSCIQYFPEDSPTGATSDIIFGGDIYIGRYTEKNTFFYFYDWLTTQPNNYEYNYLDRVMTPYPTYWVNSNKFDVNDFIQGLLTQISNAIQNVFSNPLNSNQNNLQSSGTGVFPSDYHNFDAYAPTGSTLVNNLASWGDDILQALVPAYGVKNRYFYLFNSGVKDFFVESEVNVEYRDWGDFDNQRHYDPYHHTDLRSLFRSDRIKDINFYKYDYSLSVSRFYQNFASWARVQYRNYNPEIAETCYSYWPNRVIYSLPQNKELRQDYWKSYLINNYKDFTSKVTAIKSIGKNGAFILFENEAPVSVPGVDTLQTDAGTKITIGDGGLFSQPLQNLVNADQPYEYGSCQNRLSVINTPAGLYWICQNQGKIFEYAEGLTEISQNGLKWWFEEFLPYKILEDFPNYDLLDNPVVGVGCQSIYNSNNGILYFAKKDYKLKKEYQGLVQYRERSGDFTLENVFGAFQLGDERYFDDASWTVSYDPKVKAWVSFHDWHPDLLMAGKNNHISIKNTGFWIHNDRSDSYCKFYNINYPFEVEMVSPTGQVVNTLRSIEYMMEVYEWDEEGVDRHHVLDFNFDRAIIYNTEQVSGELRLNLKPKNNAPALLNYPNVTANGIDILYSKEEHKYRFNQFWDITDDRGEFTGFTRQMWETSPNGYVKTLNPNYLDYFKAEHQRKKFRHYLTNIKLIRRVSGNKHMNLKLVNSKNQYSFR